MFELLIVGPDNAQKRFQYEGLELSIGRRPENELVLPDANVSSKHARLRIQGQTAWIEDLGSTNGTLLNGRYLRGTVAVSPEDTIQLGSFRLMVLQAQDPAFWQGMSNLLPEEEEEGDDTAKPGTLRLENAPGQTPPRSAASPSEAPGGDPPTGISAALPTAALPTAARAENVLPRQRPAVPRSVEETGLKRGTIIDLILKTTWFTGEISGYDLANEIKLPFQSVLEPLIGELRRDKLLEVKGGGSSFGAISMVYSATTRAGELIHQILERNRYVGPAPISMESYTRMVQAQSVRRTKVPRKRLMQELSHLVLDEEIYDGLGPALNSGTAILFYGPPGNGKSIICQAMVNCFQDQVFVPHAIEVDGNIIKVFDEHNHRPVERERTVELEAEFDQRWVLCHRPLIMVGGELTLDMLDMSYSPEARFYEAPFQVKANGGIFLIDDFGRQKASPSELLNRWIVPLESELDFISLVTGKKLKVPFDVFVVFATNLPPESLVDDAFLRRVRYKLEVKRPNREQYREIFRQVASSRHIPWSEEGFAYLLTLYAQDQRPFNACEPRNLLDAIVCLGDYLECAPELRNELILRAYRSYFTRGGVTG